jgi:3-dehydroquinate dehydratase/shikimate dehydrogenase
VIGGDADEVGRALAALAALAGEAPELRPGGVEVRADLCPEPRDGLSILKRLPRGLPVIFTVRLRREGGAFEGDEEVRIDLYRRALLAGAALVDAEWGSEAARALARRGAPLLLSHHDLSDMLPEAELERLSAEMASLSPRALKVVPTARQPLDGARMLEWVARARPDGPFRVGFAMGEAGLPSRVLALSRGAPITYAALGRSVAAGQLSVGEMTGLYRAPRLTVKTRVFGVIGNPVSHSLSPHLHNAALAARRLDAVYLPFFLERFTDLEPVIDRFGIAGLSVTVPFKEDACRFAAPRLDDRSRACGAANTLVFERPGGKAAPAARAYNTDHDGVLEPLRRRGLSLVGLRAGIIGAGGAARGAARALAEAGAAVVIYYRSRERGEPVALDLGVEGKVVADLAAGRHELLINATPLGLHAGDPSPVPAEVFARDTWAFDMVYDPPLTPFLLAARERGARLIPGREMLIAQAAVQFRIFTGEEVAPGELEAAFDRALARRRSLSV